MLLVLSLRVCLSRLSPIILLLVFSCIEPYEPRVDASAQNLLVVDGFINATDKNVLVRLSRTQPVTNEDDTSSNPETGATVVIDSPSGSSYSLTERSDGEYSANNLVINRNTVYTLHVTTSSGARYASDTIRVRRTPPIDSLSFNISSNNELLNVMVSTHDPLRKTRYYAWDLTETYEYNSPDSSEYKFINKQPILRTLEESVFTCWRTDHSVKTFIGTSLNLNNDVISNHTITQIPKGSLKLSVRYSALVKQRAISALEYQFLDGLNKTTEDIGSIFGAMPYAVIGNIHSVDNPLEPVLGYFSGADVTQKRFFIEYLDIPPDFRSLARNDGCIFEETCLIFPDPLTIGPQACVPLDVLNDEAIILRSNEGNSYIWTTPECGDCRAKGGKTERPPFW